MEAGTTITVASLGDQRVVCDDGNLPIIGFAKRIISFNKEKKEEQKGYVKEKRESLGKKQ